MGTEGAFKSGQHERTLHKDEVKGFDQAGAEVRAPTPEPLWFWPRTNGRSTPESLYDISGRHKVGETVDQEEKQRR